GSGPALRGKDLPPPPPLPVTAPRPPIAVASPTRGGLKYELVVLTVWRDRREPLCCDAGRRPAPAGPRSRGGLRPAGQRPGPGPTIEADVFRSLLAVHLSRTARLLLRHRPPAAGHALGGQPLRRATDDRLGGGRRVPGAGAGRPRPGHPGPQPPRARVGGAGVAGPGTSHHRPAGLLQDRGRRSLP